MSELHKKPDYQTFANNLKSCATFSNIKLGKSIHITIIKLGLNSCHLVTKSLLNMYAKCNLLNESHHIFKQIANPDIVTWNIMLSGLSGSRVCDKEVVKMFDRMKLGTYVRAISVSVAIVVPVCVRFRGMALGKIVHCYVVKSGLERETLVGNALVSMYLKMGRVWDAWKVFDGMCERDVVTWNAVVAGLVENGLVFEGFRVFREMIGEGVWPNYAAIANVLRVCGLFGYGCGLRFGKEIHCYAIRRGEVFGDVSVVNSLVEFYSKVGRMNE